MNIHAAVFEQAFGLASQLPASTLPEIVFSGRSNVGKSSLINALCRRKSLARTSATPGKTATINFYHLGNFRLVDLPGYGYAKVSGSERQRWAGLVDGYFEQDRDVRLVCQLLDLRHPPTKDDQAMLAYLVDRQIPFVVALTKADKLKPTQRRLCEQTMRDALDMYEGITSIACSSITQEGLETLRAILDEVTE